MRIEQRNLRKYQPHGSVHRCQKQKMPVVGGVSGTAPSSVITSKRSVAPITASSSAVSFGTIRRATLWPKENRAPSLAFSRLTALAIPQPAQHLRKGGALAVHQNADPIDTRRQ